MIGSVTSCANCIHLFQLDSEFGFKLRNTNNLMLVFLSNIVQYGSLTKSGHTKSGGVKIRTLQNPDTSKYGRLIIRTTHNPEEPNPETSNFNFFFFFLLNFFYLYKFIIIDKISQDYGSYKSYKNTFKSSLSQKVPFILMALPR